MGIHISSFCVEKEQREIIQWSLYDNRPLVFRVGKKKLTKVGMSTQSWSEKKTFTISRSSKIRDTEWNYAVEYALGLLSTTGRIQLPVQKAPNPSLSEVEAGTRAGIKEDLGSFTLYESITGLYWEIGNYSR